jgi:hypothetical protein
MAREKLIASIFNTKRKLPKQEAASSLLDASLLSLFFNPEGEDSMFLRYVSKFLPD